LAGGGGKTGERKKTQKGEKRKGRRKREEQKEKRVGKCFELLGHNRFHFECRGCAAAGFLKPKNRLSLGQKTPLCSQRLCQIAAARLLARGAEKFHQHWHLSRKNRPRAASEDSEAQKSNHSLKNN